MILRFGEWASTANFIILLGMCTFLFWEQRNLRRSVKDMADGKIRVARGSEQRAEDVYARTLAIFEDIKARLKG